MNKVNHAQPWVSFLVPAYNRADFLPECLNSILIQTYQNKEIIVIDDASTDNTEDLINNRFKENVKYYKNHVNRGVAYSRNLGLTHAKGDYIGLLDSDDILLDTDYVHKAVGILKSNPEIGVFTCDTYCVGLKGEKVCEKTFFQMTVDHRNIKLASGIKDFDYIFCHGIHSCGAILKKQLIIETGFLNTDYKIAWDEDFFLRASAAGTFKIYYYNSPLTAYRIHPINISNNLSELYKEKIKARINVLKCHSNLEKQSGIKFKKRLANQYYCLIDACIKEKKMLSAMFAALKAIMIYPPIFLILAVKTFTLPAKNLIRNRIK